MLRLLEIVKQNLYRMNDTLLVTASIPKLGRFIINLKNIISHMETSKLVLKEQNLLNHILFSKLSV